MARKFKVGQLVEQVLPAPITGTIKKFAFDETTGDVDITVQRVVTDADGAEHVAEVVFGEDEITLIAEAEADSAMEVTAHVAKVAGAIIEAEKPLVEAANEAGAIAKKEADQAALEAAARS